MSRDRAATYWIGRVAALLLGAVLLVAAWAKVLDPLAFAEQISREGLDLVLPARWVAVVAIALEIGLGLALMLGLRRLWILVPTGLMIVLFLFLTGRAYWLWANGMLDEAAACGCFGNLVERTPAEAFWQDALMLVPLYLLSFLGRAPSGDRRGGRWRVVVTAVAVVAGVIFTWLSPSLPLDDLATRLSPGTEISSLCAGAGDEADRICLDVLLPPLADGDHWVVLAGLEEEALRSGVEALNRLALEGDVDGVWVLSADPPEVHQAFFWQVGPVFEVREVPLALIRPLYRTTPRSFRLEDGMVTRTVSGLPPPAHGDESPAE
ncbi:MAG: hypothetical protein R3244_09115 [Thermoanaerobaculia bacterium]|nr:hypothetical protein [Thermoanaerobaculia bacterium]